MVSLDNQLVSLGAPNRPRVRLFSSLFYIALSFRVYVYTLVYVYMCNISFNLPFLPNYVSISIVS